MNLHLLCRAINERDTVPGYHYYVMLEETEDGGWAPTVHFTYTPQWPAWLLRPRQIHGSPL